jgi:hypothetical protein
VSPLVRLVTVFCRLLGPTWPRGLTWDEAGRGNPAVSNEFARPAADPPYYPSTSVVDILGWHELLGAQRSLGRLTASARNLLAIVGKPLSRPSLREDCMIPRRYGVALTNRVTLEEFQRLWLIRLETLADCTARVSGGKPLPVSWRSGWQARLNILSRDRDGSLRASVTVTRPNSKQRWVRNVRLVKPKALRLHYK